jgi:3-oxoacyl-[acyl-carrier-protein] synthase II
MSRRVVITGLGVVSPAVIGREAFWANLTSGRTGIKPITLFDTARLSCKQAGEISEFDPHEMLPGMKTGMLNRTAQLVCAAARLGLEDAGIELNDVTRPQIGVMIGSTLGIMQTYSEFERGAITKGYVSASPMDFANTIALTTAGYISILFGVSSFNSLISSGESSSLDAINYGASFVRSGQAEMVLAGGVEALSLETFLINYLPRFLSGSKPGEREFCAPYGRGRNGFVLGESGALVVLENYDHAVARGARIYGEVRSVGTTFDRQAFCSSTPPADGLMRALNLAISRSELTPEKIDYFSACANSSVAVDQAEASAIRNVFGSRVGELQISAVKSMTGECFGASVGVQVCATALALHEGIVPPTLNCNDPDPDCALPLFSASREVEIKTALIGTVAANGFAGALVITKP